MLLKELNKEQLKYFMKIINEFVTVDSNLAKEEEELIERYLKKLEISREDISKISTEEAMNYLCSAEIKIKKIVYFELLGIALIDGEYETSEVDYLEDIATKFEIKRAEKIAFANYYFDYDNMIKLSDEDKTSKLAKLFL